MNPSTFLISACLALLSAAAQAQVSFTGTDYTQNFDGMGTAGTTAPTGWSFFGNLGGSGSTWTDATGIPAAAAGLGTANATLTATTTQSNSSNTAGYNRAFSTATSDRSLSTSPTSGRGVVLQLSLTNGTGAALNGIVLSYDTIRYSAPATANELPGYRLFYSLDSGTSWTNVSALNPTLTGSSGVVVPNTVGTTTVADANISFATAWANGGNLRLRWIDDNATETSPDQIHGIDNVSISLPQPAPTVSLTSPANGATFENPATVNLAATASDTNGTVTKVEFFEGAAKLGESLTPPYQYQWTGMFSGSYSLTAVATDNDGASTISASVNITVTNPNNSPPTVALTSPLDSTTIPASSLTLSATASDSDGIVSKVEFYEGAQKIGEDATSPYTFEIANFGVGPHTYSAKAIDNDGGTTDSSSATVSAVAYTETTSIARGGTWKFLDDGSDQGTAWKESAFVDTAWASGPAKLGYGDSPVTILRQGPAGTTSAVKYITYYFRKTFTIAPGAQVIGLSANLLRDDGAVIYLNGTEIGRSNMPSGPVNYLTESATAVGGADETTFFPLTLPYDAIVEGVNTVAVSIHQQATTSSDLSFDMDLVILTEGGNARPTVAITAPAANSSSSVGSPITIAADAADSDGSISKVEFFAGSTKLGEDTVSPYSFVWQNPSAGSYSLTAVATDNLGATSTSAPVPVTVMPGPSGTLQRGPYLNMANQDSIVIRWRSSSSVVGRVRYGLTPENLNSFTDESAAQTNHVVRLTGLSPYTRYYYSVGSANDSLTPQSVENTSFRPGASAPTAADYTFRTSPVPGTPVDTRIWIVGDCGRGTQVQANGRDAYYGFTGNRTPDLNLQMGDNAYNSGTDAEYQSGYFNMYADIFRKMPQWSTLGNHDANNGNTNPLANHPYFDMFTFPASGECGGVPSGTEHYYSFDYGNIHFICLDSQASVTTVDDPGTPNTNEDGPMAIWLRADLASNTATWTIAFWHHPPYSKGSHDSDSSSQLVNMRTRFNPIMEEGGVDLLFFGHSHNYERSVLLDGHYGTSGTITAAMKKNSGNGSVGGFTTGASGKIRNAANGFTATSTVNGAVIPGDGAYVKPLTGPRDHFGAVYNTAGMSGLTGSDAINHNAMYISYNTVGTVNLDVSGNTLTSTFIQSGGTAPDNFTIIKRGAADTDGDGISDEFEIANGLDRYTNDAGGSAGDSDGLINYLEFAFGLDPRLNDASALEVDVPGALLSKRGIPITWYQTTSNGTDFRAIWIRRKDYADNGLVYTPQFSGDLVTWADSAVTPTVIGSSGEVEAVSVNYPLFVAGKEARFFRISVTTVR